ncbi:MAG: RluA family pseudouridine synthase [Planctomycetota bacterium]
MLTGLVTFRVRKDDLDRLDVYLTGRFPGHSRAFFQKLIRAGFITVNEVAAKASYLVRPGDAITLRIPEDPRRRVVPEDIPLPILYEDKWIMAIDKPPGMVVHPARGHWRGTVANALLGYAKKLSELGGDSRPGIVHRLDKDTSGVLLIAKDEVVHGQLGQQFEYREVEKTYWALVEGDVPFDEDVIDLPLGRDPRDYKRMTIRHDGRKAETRYRVLERFPGNDRRPPIALIECRPRTGRMHQIRVHLAKRGFPVVCDAVYGKRAALLRRDVDPSAPEGEVLLGRQALHARSLSVWHPALEEKMTFTAELPADMMGVIETLRATAGSGGRMKKVS